MILVFNCFTLSLLIQIIFLLMNSSDWLISRDKCISFILISGLIFWMGFTLICLVYNFNFCLCQWSTLSKNKIIRLLFIIIIKLHYFLFFFLYFYHFTTFLFSKLFFCLVTYLTIILLFPALLLYNNNYKNMSFFNVCN